MVFRTWGPVSDPCWICLLVHASLRLSLEDADTAQTLASRQVPRHQFVLVGMVKCLHSESLALLSPPSASSSSPSTATPLCTFIETQPRRCENRLNACILSGPFRQSVLVDMVVFVIPSFRITRAIAPSIVLIIIAFHNHSALPFYQRELSSPQEVLQPLISAVHKLLRLHLALVPYPRIASSVQ